MNKTLIVSMVALLGVAGGAYYMVDSDKKFDLDLGSNLNITQYIPDPIADLLGIESDSTENTDVATVAVTEMIDSIESTNSEDESIVDDTAETATDTNNDQNIFMEAPVESNSEVTEMAEITEDAAAQTHEPENKVTQLSPEARQVEINIQANNSEIYKLEAANKELEMLFQKILKQNRALAEKLSELDEKIAALN